MGHLSEKPFTGFARTRAIVYPTLKKLFAQAGINDSEIKKMISCSQNNQEIMKEIFSSTLDSYDSTHQRELKERRDRSETKENWSVTVVDVFSDNYMKVETKKNIYDHYYHNKIAIDGKRC